MDKNIKIVKKHFLDEIYIKEMLDRNINGLQDWERIVVNKYFKNKNSKILNIGCGTGREAMVLAKHGFDITGIDISEKEINIAKEEAIKENLYIEYKLCNGLDLEFENNLFDYSIMWAQTLGNIYTKKNRLKILMENKRILKQNGILSFSTHDYDFVKHNYGQYTKGNRFYPYLESNCYWKLFTVKEIIELINGIGLGLLFCGRAKELDKRIETDVLICICKK